MLSSIRKNKKGIILIIFSSICACIGQLLWKISIEKDLFYLLLGFLIYAIGAFVMIIAYRYGSLSVLQPFLSLNYVLSIFLGYFILDEIITIYKIIGVLLIIIGVLLIAMGDQ